MSRIAFGALLVGHRGPRGAALSLVLFGLFFTPWWLLAIVISTALGVVALRELTAA